MSDEDWDRYITAMPPLEDGPPKRSWRPASPACVGDRGPGLRPAVRFSVVTEDGETHRYLVTLQGAVEIAAGLGRAVSPSWMLPLIRWWDRYHHRRLFQAFRSSGMRNREGSPQLGQSQ